MNDEQFKEIRLHLRVMIAMLGVIAGIMASIAWNVQGIQR